MDDWQLGCPGLKTGIFIRNADAPSQLWVSFGSLALHQAPPPRQSVGGASPPRAMSSEEAVKNKAPCPPAKRRAGPKHDIGGWFAAGTETSPRMVSATTNYAGEVVLYDVLTVKDLHSRRPSGCGGKEDAARGPKSTTIGSVTGLLVAQYQDPYCLHDPFYNTAADKLTLFPLLYLIYEGHLQTVARILTLCWLRLQLPSVGGCSRTPVRRRVTPTLHNVFPKTEVKHGSEQGSQRDIGCV